ncbi:MAG: hypothetical protein E6J91_14285 [Deltaproteobacteria bacterium]|nr:MAG: hypothetical protein E6J91_14285 [Deltaproteobacteria bacterium]
MTFQKILCPIDFSEDSQQALQVAAETAAMDDGLRDAVAQRGAAGGPGARGGQARDVSHGRPAPRRARGRDKAAAR